MFEKFEHLLNKGIITERDLLLAFEISKNSAESIEAILNYQFMVPKVLIGESLSIHYNCGFMAYDPQMPIATELFQDLRKTNLLNDCWAPVSWDINGILVLVEDPLDPSKRVVIEDTLNPCPILYAVGIKEDIEAIINQSFNQLEVERLIFDDCSSRHPVEAAKFVDNVLICL